MKRSFGLVIVALLMITPLFASGVNAAPEPTSSHEVGSVRTTLNSEIQSDEISDNIIETAEIQYADSAALIVVDEVISFDAIETRDGSEIETK